MSSDQTASSTTPADQAASSGTPQDPTTSSGSSLGSRGALPGTPGDQRRSVWISTSVSLFIVLTSFCGILSLSTNDNYSKHKKQYDEQHSKELIRVPLYSTDIVILSVMSVGIVAMVVFMFKRKDLTTEDNESSSRHKRHRKYSFWSIALFFLAVCTLGLNYVAVEFCCMDKWVHCHEKDVYINNSFELTFHFVLVAFASCETLVCWMVKDLVLKPSQFMVWHGLAVVQAANVALWFNSVFKESRHRIERNQHSIYAYFSFCNSSSMNGSFSNETIYEPCTEEAPVSRWFVMSIPYLYPITIEFSLLVSETFLYKVIGANSHSFNGNAAEATNNNNLGNQSDNYTPAETGGTEETPLLPRMNENYRPTISCCSKLFIGISVIANTVFVLLSILMFSAYQSDSPENGHQLQKYDDVFSVYCLIYTSFFITCCAIGIGISCWGLERQPSYISFLEYLLLFSTSGLLLESIKVITCYAVTKQHSPWDNSRTGWVPVYYTLQVVGIIQVILQIVFYFCSKDVSENPNSRTRVAVLKNVMVVIAINNIATWISDSFCLIELNSSITPYDFLIEEWPVFDNVVIPIVIFFRFNSALLFWCNA